MSLTEELRPKTLDEVVGNESNVETISRILERPKNKIPKAWLFIGQSGCGKTTFARIVASELGCSDMDFHEYNSALEDKGVNAVRNIRQVAHLAPSSGEVKVFFLDECFDGNSMVSTINGDKKIKDIKVGESLFNLNGIDKVEHVFKNKVELGRVVKVNTSDGKSTFCSSDHLFYKDSEWIKSKDLTGLELLQYDCDQMKHIISQHKEGDSEYGKNLSKLRRYINYNNPNFLLKQLFSFVSGKEQTKNNFQNIRNYLRELQDSIHHKLKEDKVLFPKLCWEMEKSTTFFSGKNVYEGKERKGKKEITDVPSIQRRIRKTPAFFRENEIKQPWIGSNNSSKDESHETNKRDFGSLEKQSWREWEGTNRTTKTSICSFGMGNRVCSEYLDVWKRLSQSLQIGYSKFTSKNRNRGRWSKSQMENIRGQKENRTPKKIRVESVEIYKRGSNDRSFEGVIGDQERNQGFIEFYDLQIQENPSYIINNVMVHNCHMMTKPAQEGILKLLESPPKNTFFFLCTTNPESLIPTLKGRCALFQVFPNTSKKIFKYLKRVCKNEDFNVEEDVLKKITQSCNGAMRTAVMLLDMVKDLEDETTINAIIDSGGAVEDMEIIEIAKVLLFNDQDAKVKWKMISPILKKYKKDSESSRIQLREYINAVLLNSGSSKHANVLACFVDNYFSAGSAGLTLSCYHACKA